MVLSNHFFRFQRIYLYIFVHFYYNIYVMFRKYFIETFAMV